MHGRAVALGAGPLLNALSIEAGPVIKGVPEDVNGVVRRCTNSTPMAEPAPTLPSTYTPGRCRPWRTTTRNDGTRIL